MSLAHQERVTKVLHGNKGKIEDFKFSLQWIHNKYEYKLKKLLIKAKKLEEGRDKLAVKYQTAKDELEEVQNDDGVSVVKKLLFSDAKSRYKTNESVRTLDGIQTEKSRDIQYLSFSDSGEEERKEFKDNITTCSSSQSKLKTLNSATVSNLNPDQLRQLELKNKRQALGISLFGTLVDDFMTCPKPRFIEESRLAMEGEELSKQNNAQFDLGLAGSKYTSKLGKFTFLIRSYLHLFINLPNLENDPHMRASTAEFSHTDKNQCMEKTSAFNSTTLTPEFEKYIAVHF